MPQPGRMEKASATVSSVAGTIKSTFENSPDQFILRAEIPTNTTAIIGIPSGFTRIIVNDSLVWENGRYINETLAFIDQDDSYVKFKIQNGNWKFRAVEKRNNMNLTNKRRTNLKRLVIVMVLHLLPIGVLATPIFGPIDLRTEYLLNPLGIDSPQPRFTWRLEDERRGAIQTAYKIIVGKDSLDVVKGKGNIWKSKKIKSNKNLVIYQGKKLEPFTKYYWKVELWDRNGKNHL